MADETLVAMALGFLITIAVRIWSKHRQTRLLNARIDEMKADHEKDMAELKADIRAQDERHRILEGKVDRIQGSLDVLIHAYRHEPLAQPVEERQMSETTAD